ncbi:MAG: cyclic nucleotide-gated ion channel [Pseudolabrys sp.]
MTHQRFEDLTDALQRLRAGRHHILQYSVLAVGLVAMMALTIAGLEPRFHFRLVVVLWCCLGYFACKIVMQAVRPGPDTASNYFLSAAFVVDALVILPVPIALLAGVPDSTAWLLASLWLINLTAAAPGLSLLTRVVVTEARPLGSVLMIFLIVLLAAGILLHLLERAGQPDQFGSLPMAMWWAVTTLTTTGYGDAVPATFFGRVIAGFVMICGLGVFGLLTGILATSFASEHRRRDFVRNWRLVTRVPFLRNLDAASINELTRMLRHLDVKKDTVVVRRGRPGDCMYFIAAGEVEVKVEPQPIRLGAGDFFGEIALLEGGVRNATVVATAPTTLLILDVSDFREFTARHSQLAKAVEVAAANRKKNQNAENSSKRKLPVKKKSRPRNASD